MNEETKTRIFQPFFSTKGFEQGNGLGMSGAYSIISEHKGKIYVKESAPDEGTTIEFTLPYSRAKKTSEKETVKKNNGSARILWVDDEEVIRHSFNLLLDSMGHQAEFASSGKEALELLENNQYDLMITDIGMPYMSGWQLAEKIKGKYKEMKVAIVSGWGDEVSNKEKKKYGVGYVLRKPTESKKIEDMIREVMQMKQK